jgi:hypothetical protein
MSEAVLWFFSAGKQHEQIQIENNAVGYSYDRLFSRFLNQFVTNIEVEDPYIRSNHQVGTTSVEIQTGSVSLQLPSQ